MYVWPICMACIVIAESLQQLPYLCYEDITICLIGIQNCGWSYAIKAEKGQFFCAQIHLKLLRSFTEI